MNWLAVTRDSRLEVDLVSPEMILQADQFPFSKLDEKFVMKKSCKGGTSFLSECTVLDLAGDVGKNTGLFTLTKFTVTHTTYRRCSGI
jgi:hypothetical protein